jgi:hypothetical protein
MDLNEKTQMFWERKLSKELSMAEARDYQFRAAKYIEILFRWGENDENGAKNEV